MKGIFLSLIALVVLGAVALGAYMHFSKPQDAVASIQEEKIQKPNDQPYAFVELAPLTLPIVDRQGVNQVVNMVVALEVSSSANEEKVRLFSPKLTDAYISEMYGVLSRRATLKGGVIQVNAIKKRLTNITHKILGKDTVEDVLLQVVDQRKI